MRDKDEKIPSCRNNRCFGCWNISFGIEEFKHKRVKGLEAKVFQAKTYINQWRFSKCRNYA